MLEHLNKTEPGRNPERYRVPETFEEYKGRTWRGLESDAIWAAEQLRTKGVFALRDVVPKDEVAALRKKAGDSWCAVANALYERDLAHCLFWKVRGWGEFKGARECRDEVKFPHEYVAHEPGALGNMELILGSESALVVGAHKRVLKKMWPILKRVRPDLVIDECGAASIIRPHWCTPSLVRHTGAASSAIKIRMGATGTTTRKKSPPRKGPPLHCTSRCRTSTRRTAARTSCR
jgi:hypothetical protein